MDDCHFFVHIFVPMILTWATLKSPKKKHWPMCCVGWPVGYKKPTKFACRVTIVNSDMERRFFEVPSNFWTKKWSFISPTFLEYLEIEVVKRRTFCQKWGLVWRKVVEGRKVVNFPSKIHDFFFNFVIYKILETF